VLSATQQVEGARRALRRQEGEQAREHEMGRKKTSEGDKSRGAMADADKTTWLRSVGVWALRCVFRKPDTNVDFNAILVDGAVKGGVAYTAS